MAACVVDVKTNVKYKSYDCVLEKDSDYFLRTRRKKVVTSWWITLFWILLSMSTAVLATYSFLQADWVVKRNVIITKLYLPENRTRYGFDKYYHSPVTSRVSLHSKFLKRNFSAANRMHLASFINFIRLEQAHANYNTSHKFLMHSSRPRRVTKLMTTIRFGIIGVCSSFKSYMHCRLFSPNDTHPVPRIWNLVLVIGGMGCMTLCATAVLSILAAALPSSQLRYRIAITIGHAQTIAVILLLGSLLLFPLGFDSDFVKFHCGVFAGPYRIPDCEIGWAYALVLVCGSLALYCPILVKFTADIFDSLPKYL